MGLKRYRSPSTYYGTLEPVEDPAGEWVRYEDIFAANLELLRAERRLLVGAEETLHVHADGSATITRSEAGSDVQVYVRHVPAGEPLRLEAQELRRMGERCLDDREEEKRELP